MVYLPASGLLLTGDVMMPCLGAPFFAEGSAEVLLETLGFIRDLRPRALIRGYPTLTDLFTVYTLEGLQIALGALREHVLDSIGRGLTLPAILDAAYLPKAPRQHPGAVVPYLVTRDNFAARLYHQRTGCWEADGHGLAPQPAAARPCARPARLGGEEPFARAAAVLTGQGDPPSRRRSSSWACCGTRPAPRWPGSGKTRCAAWPSSTSNSIRSWRRWPQWSGPAGSLRSWPASRRCRLSTATTTRCWCTGSSAKTRR
jgi:hypothetical protein